MSITIHVIPNLLPHADAHRKSRDKLYPPHAFVNIQSQGFDRKINCYNCINSKKYTVDIIVRHNEKHITYNVNYFSDEFILPSPGTERGTNNSKSE